jgi:hypothetical protein
MSLCRCVGGRHRVGGGVLDETLAIHRAMNDDEPLSGKQAESVDDALAVSLYGLTDRPGDPRARFALYRATIKRTRQADELHAALKATRPSFQPAADD